MAERFCRNAVTLQPGDAIVQLRQAASSNAGLPLRILSSDNFEHDAPVLRSAELGRVARDGLLAPEPFSLDTLRRDAVGDQRAHYRFSARLGQREVLVFVA